VPTHAHAAGDGTGRWFVRFLHQQPESLGIDDPSFDRKGSKHRVDVYKLECQSEWALMYMCRVGTDTGVIDEIEV
jgi:hypothetical protein